MRSWESVRPGESGGAEPHGRMDHSKEELEAQRLTFGYYAGNLMESRVALRAAGDHIKRLRREPTAREDLP